MPRNPRGSPSSHFDGDPDDADETARGGRAERPRARRSSEDHSSKTPGGPGFFERVVFGRIGSAQLAMFCRQSATYLKSGVDLVKALDSLRKQFAGTAFAGVIDRMSASIRGGDSLTEAMAREPQAFDTFFLSMMRVAEARGGEPETLRRLAQHYESKQQLIRQARSALIYPVSVITIALGVMWLLTAFVLPKLLALVEDTLRGKGELPAPTRLLIALTNFVQKFGWWAGPIALVLVVFGLIQFHKTPAGKAVLDRLLLRIPVLGKLLRQIDTARFAGTMAPLLDAGVAFDDSLKLTSEVLRMQPIRAAVAGARDVVKQGGELSAALDDSRQFFPDVIATIQTGEETGRLPESLEKLAENYEEQVEYAVQNLGSLIKPLLMLIIGGFVFFIAIAFFMAYASMISGLAAP